MPSVFLGLQCLPEVEALAATRALSQPWPPTSLGWFGSQRKVAAPQWELHQDPGDRIWAKLQPRGSFWGIPQ